ncbi:MAG: EF-hand domain-containing protein [Pseudomonadota bacterium]
MSSIGSISGSSAYSSSASNVHRQRPDPSKIADSVFSKLDTKSQGYLEVADLESAFNNISSGTGNSSSTSTDNSTADALFKKLDSDGDGKVTKREFSTGLKKLSDELESQFNARRTTDATNTQGPQGANRPPPPPPSDSDQDAGVSQTQLAAMASDISSTDSTAGANLSKVAANFEAADTNQDGKVSLKETIAYIEKSAVTSSASSATSTSTASADSSSDSTSNTDAALFKKVLQLLQAYADPFQVGDKSSAGSNISVSA